MRLLTITGAVNSMFISAPPAMYMLIPGKIVVMSIVKDSLLSTVVSFLLSAIILCKIDRGIVYRTEIIVGLGSRMRWRWAGLSALLVKRSALWSAMSLI
jgi:hypothetical protein